MAVESSDVHVDVKEDDFASYGSQDGMLKEVTSEVVELWLRRARRKFLNGVTVIRVLHSGKLTKRQLFINAKPNYLELISAKLFDIAYHLSEIEELKHGTDSSDFKAFFENEGSRHPKDGNALVIKLKDNEKPISLVFYNASDRMDAEMLLRVQRIAANKEAVINKSTGDLKGMMTGQL